MVVRNVHNDSTSLKSHSSQGKGLKAGRCSVKRQTDIVVCFSQYYLGIFCEIMTLKKQSIPRKAPPPST